VLGRGVERRDLAGMDGADDPGLSMLLSTLTGALVRSIWNALASLLEALLRIAVGVRGEPVTAESIEAVLFWMLVPRIRSLSSASSA
jgi:hypothetical protein